MTGPDGSRRAGPGAHGTWAELRGQVTARLDAAGIPHADLEARWLVEHVRDEEPTAPPDRAVGQRLDALLARREAGEPLQYVLGSWPFRTIELAVDRRALIPRPETEQVAGAALWELQTLGVDEPVVVDLGTGCGAIALSIAVEHPSAWVLGVEASPDALELAMQNRDRLGLGVRQVALARGSWFSRLPEDLRGGVDLVVTNPPYVATGEVLDPLVRDWEPHLALFAGDDGLDDLRHIIAEAPGWLRSGGVLVAEIGADQGAAVTGLARKAGFAHVEVRPDLAGHDRILVAGRA